jgi:hypothetical protein
MYGCTTELIGGLKRLRSCCRTRPIIMSLEARGKAAFYGGGGIKSYGVSFQRLRLGWESIILA